VGLLVSFYIQGRYLPVAGKENPLNRCVTLATVEGINFIIRDE